MPDANHFVRRRKTGAVLAAVAVAAIAGTALAAVNTGGLKGNTALTPVAAIETVAPPAGAPVSFADVIERVSPAVVNIQVARQVDDRSTNSPRFRGDRPNTPPFDDFFRRFFDDEEFQRRFGGRGPDRERAPRRAAGLGSGFIISADGYVVSNDHVVGEADEITVILGDGRKYEAALVGRDPKTDLALLKIEDGEDLPFVRFAETDSARVGDWVVAVGNPFGLGQTVTAGIVSARGRTIGAGPYDDFLQIDAAINRGNSGGPAFNLKGEVIGVNTAILSPSGGSVGIGFAIPAGLAQDVIADLRDDGRIERGWLGVSIQGVTDDIAESLDLDKARGAIVSDVTPDSPAAAAGIQAGDVIVAVNGEAVESVRTLPRLIAEIDPGETAELGIWRRGSEIAVDVEIGELDETPEVASLQNDDATAEDALGLQLARLDPSARRAFDIGPDVDGVVIADVAPDSQAAEKGLRPGDVIVAVDTSDVSTPADVVAGIKAVKDKGQNAVLLRVSRDARERFVALRLRAA